MVIIAKDSSDIPRYLLVDADGHIQADILTSSPISGRFKAYEDTSFLAGDSPITLDVNTDLGRNGKDGFIICDGAGNFTVAISNDGSTFGSAHTMKSGEVFSLTNIDIDSIKLTRVADSAYRVVVN